MKQSARPNPRKLSIGIACCLLMLATQSSYISKVQAGGKGKGGRQGHIIIQNDLKGSNHPVPIYMPIPVPIPMPVPAHPGGHKHHSSSSSGDAGGGNGGNGGGGDGEVKKIYILQPMPRAPTQGHGYTGSKDEGFQQNSPPQPVSNYYANKQAKQLGQHYNHNNPPSGNYENSHSTSGTQTGGRHGVQILPIVVIPPIAPMVPIHVSAHGGSHDSRKKLLSMLYDQKSFADYNGPSNQSPYSRDSDSPSSSRRMRMLQRSANSAGLFPSRIQDEFMDEIGESRRAGRLADRLTQLSGAGSHAAARRRSQVNSIRDIVEKGMFDDEPSSMSSLEFDRRRMVSYPDCCPELSGSRFLAASEADISMDGSSIVDQRNLPFDRQLQSEGSFGNLGMSKHQPSAQLSGDIFDDYSSINARGSIRFQQNHRPTSAGRMQSNSLSNSRFYNSDNLGSRSFGRPSDLDSILNNGNEDDEWRFDSVKSISYSNPPISSNNTIDNFQASNATAPSAQVTELVTVPAPSSNDRN